MIKLSVPPGSPITALEAFDKAMWGDTITLQKTTPSGTVKWNAEPSMACWMVYTLLWLVDEDLVQQNLDALKCLL